MLLEPYTKAHPQQNPWTVIFTSLWLYSQRHMYLQPWTKRGKLPVIHILCVEKTGGEKWTAEEKCKMQVRGLEWDGKCLQLARKWVSDVGYWGKEEYPALNWLYGLRSLDLRFVWPLKECSDKTGGCTRSKSKFFSLLSAWVGWHAYVTLLPGQKTCSVEAGPDHWLPCSRGFSTWASASLLTFFSFLGCSFQPDQGTYLSWGWLAFAPWAMLWGTLPAECLQWVDLTQQGPLNGALRLSCNINPKTNSYMDKL